MKKYRRINIAMILVLVLVITIGCNKANIEELNYSDTVVLTVDDSSVFLDELMYHVMLQEMQGELYASFLDNTDFWNKEYSDGVTMRDIMKQEAMNNAIKYELLYHVALDQGYTLTNEEIQDCKNKVESIEKSIQEEDRKARGLTGEKLLEIQKKIVLSTRYYQDYYSSKEIDDETAFEQMKDGHKIKINEKVWKQVTFGEKKVNE